MLKLDQQPLSVLLVEDDHDVAASLTDALEAFGMSVHHVDNGLDCFNQVAERQPGLVLLDLELPSMEGDEICRTLRERSYNRMPIIALSGCQDDDAIVRMLEAGADDFVSKSQPLTILVAHIRAILNRCKRLIESPPDSDSSACGPIQINKASKKVWILNREITPTPTERVILETLLSSPGTVFTRGQIIDKLHGVGYSITPRTVDVHINALRNHLGEFRQILETVRGIGYRLTDGAQVGR